MLELRVSALLLAAGSSSRMGTSKQLLRLGNKTVIRRCIDTIIASGIGDIVVVANEETAKAAHNLEGPSVRFAVNALPKSDMAESVRIGLRALGEMPTGILICLADHPLASSSTMKSLALEHYAFCSKIIIPVYQGKRGHPTLFPREVLHEVLSGNTLEDAVRKEPRRVRLLEVADEGVVLDMDTRKDYERIARKAVA